MEFYSDGLDFMEELLQRYQLTDEKTLTAMETGAQRMAADVRKLPKPRSRVNASGYTHLLDTVTYRRTKNEVEVGWGKYYGPMVENGTVRARAIPHILTTFQTNKQKYYQIIERQLWK